MLIIKTMNWLKQILIERTTNVLDSRKKQSGAKLFFFENKIGNIDSISLLPNKNGAVTPVLWKELSVKQILEIKKRLNTGKFFYYKDLPNGRMKLRPRKEK